MRRRALVLSLPALAAACAGKPPTPPLTPLQPGRLLVLGPTADFDTQHLPAGWSRSAPDRNAVITVTQEAGRPVLTLDAPGGTTLVRAIDVPLVEAPGLSWAWKVEADAFLGGPGDGLARGLRLVIGFAGGGPTDLIRPASWMRSTAGFPPHDRRIEIALRGPGVTLAELAMLELDATAEDGTRLVLRGPARNMTGGWISEFVDLLALFRRFFPNDRFDVVTIAFIAIGALPARPPESIPATIGHIVEVQVFR